MAEYWKKFSLWIIKYPGLGFIVIGLFKLVEVNPFTPSSVTEEEWKELVQNPCAKKGNAVIGFLERILYIVVFYMGSTQIIAGVIGGWLAFKVASKWQVWSSIVRVPESLGGQRMSDLTARLVWGSQILTRFWVGTLANILIGFSVANLLRYFHFL